MGMMVYSMERDHPVQDTLLDPVVMEEEGKLVVDNEVEFFYV